MVRSAGGEKGGGGGGGGGQRGTVCQEQLEVKRAELMANISFVQDRSSGSTKREKKHTKLHTNNRICQSLQQDNHHMKTAHPVRQNRSTTILRQFREKKIQTTNQKTNKKVLVICKSEHASTTTKM